MMNTNETDELEKKRDLRQPFIALSIALALVIVRYMDRIVHDLHWLVSGLLAGVFAKIILSLFFSEDRQAKRLIGFFLCVFSFL